MTRAFALLPALVAPLITACSEQAPEISQAIVRDSGGITIVENREFAPQEWLAERTAQIGVADGEAEYQFFRVGDMVRLDDGTIVVLNTGTAELRFYTADGVHLRTVGGRGEGPGEYRSPSTLVRLHNDTLVVFGFADGRLTWLTSEGDFIRSQPVDRGAIVNLGAQFGASHGARLLPDMSYLLPLMQSGDVDIYHGVVRPPEGYAWAPNDLSDAKLLGWFPGIEQINLGSMERADFLVLPFSRMTVHAAGGDPLEIYIGTNDDFEIRKYSRAGELRALVRKAHTPVPVTEEAMAQWSQRARENMQPRYDEAGIDRRLGQLPVPSSLPPYGQLHVDELGNLWVQEYQVESADSARYFVFDSAGQLTASVAFDGGIVPMHIGGDNVLAVFRDADQVEYVRSYRLQRES
jgi:hypothetical protein